MYGFVYFIRSRMNWTFFRVTSSSIATLNTLYNLNDISLCCYLNYTYTNTLGVFHVDVEQGKNLSYIHFT